MMSRVSVRLLNEWNESQKEIDRVQAMGGSTLDGLALPALVVYSIPAALVYFVLVRIDGQNLSVPRYPPMKCYNENLGRLLRRILSTDRTAIDVEVRWQDPFLSHDILVFGRTVNKAVFWIVY